MRQLLLVALISSMASSALAQTHDLPSPDGPAVHAAQPGAIVAINNVKTELEKEAQRVSVFRQKMGLDNPAPAPLSTPTPLRPNSAQAALAPNGLQPMKLYETNSSATVHTVVKDDTLYNISKRYSVSLNDLRQANQISGTNIQLGQNILIPARKQAVLETPYPNVRKVIQPVPAESDSESGSISEAETQRVVDPEQPKLQIYAVVPKDTISAISRRTCVPAKQLITVNALTNPDTLRPGQRLTLPDGHCLTQ